MYFKGINRPAGRSNRFCRFTGTSVRKTIPRKRMNKGHSFRMNDTFIYDSRARSAPIRISRAASRVYVVYYYKMVFI
jgi:hypothetical protein